MKHRRYRKELEKHRFGRSDNERLSEKTKQRLNEMLLSNQLWYDLQKGYNSDSPMNNEASEAFRKILKIEHILNPLDNGKPTYPPKHIIELLDRGLTNDEVRKLPVNDRLDYLFWSEPSERDAFYKSLDRKTYMRLLYENEAAHNDYYSLKPDGSQRIIDLPEALKFYPIGIR